MTKAQEMANLEVLASLKNNECITGYRIEGSEIIPEWLSGGAERAANELMNNGKPFGLKKGRRAYLMRLLPLKNRNFINELFLAKIRNKIEQ